MFSIVSSSSHCGPKLQQASRALGDWLRPSPPTNWNSSDCYGEDKKQIQIVLQKPAKKQKIGDLPRLELSTKSVFVDVIPQFRLTAGPLANVHQGEP